MNYSSRTRKSPAVLLYGSEFLSSPEVTDWNRLVTLVSMHRFAFFVIAALLTSFFSPARAASKAEFDAAFKQSNQDNSTSAGKRYTREFEDKIFTAIAGEAMRSCLSAPDTTEPAMLIFVISADGKIRRVLSTPGIKYGECIVSKFRLPISVPRPPHDDFAIAEGVANHSHAEKNAPVDKPARVEGDSALAYDRAIAPYVAKARETYPSAKTRFLAGLPPGWRFAVSYRLLQKDDASREFRFEDVIVEVDKIKGGTIYGRIANKLGIVTNYHYNQEITFPESKVMNWLFIRPDGSEEGNVLGKFLDHYKPQKQ
jgi:uncharacterized protein YegJ (DUF2314 family)